MIPKNPKEYYESFGYKWERPEWQELSNDTREYYIIEYDKRFVYNESIGGGCGDIEIPLSQPLFPER